MCLSLTGLFHLAKYSPVPSTLSQMVGVPFLFLLHSIPLCKCTLSGLAFALWLFTLTRQAGSLWSLAYPHCHHLLEELTSWSRAVSRLWTRESLGEVKGQWRGVPCKSRHSGKEHAVMLTRWSIMSPVACNFEILTYIFIYDTWVNSSETMIEKQSFCSV